MTMKTVLALVLALTLGACAPAPSPKTDDGAAERAKTAEAFRNSKYADLQPVGGAAEKKVAELEKSGKE
jgi:hypothetical protein